MDKPKAKRVVNARASMRLMYIGEYRESRFAGNRKPALNTLKRWIDNGYLKGARIGARYYVDLDGECNDNKDSDPPAAKATRRPRSI